MVNPVAEVPTAGRYELSQLRSLEAEAIHIIREVAAEFEKPVLLFSGGKDSIVMLHLAIKSLPPENSSTGFSNSAATSRMMWIASASSDRS